MAQDAFIVIQGEVHLADASSSIPNATIYVRLVDVSLADAPSEVIAEEVLENVSIDSEHPTPITFSIRASNLDEDASYSLSVHVDLSGSGDISVGDYITMQSYPVSSTGSTGYLHVQVRQVR
jgi:uncharacterized lipoprotein YbaY